CVLIHVPNQSSCLKHLLTIGGLTSQDQTLVAELYSSDPSSLADITVVYCSLFKHSPKCASTASTIIHKNFTLTLCIKQTLNASFLCVQSLHSNLFINRPTCS